MVAIFAHVITSTRAKVFVSVVVDAAQTTVSACLVAARVRLFAVLPDELIGAFAFEIRRRFE